MTKKKARVKIPRNPDKLIELGEGIVAEHTALGVNSPLSGLDMAAFGTRVNSAKLKNTEQKQLRKDAETATEDRDDLLGTKKDQNMSTPGTVLNFIVRSRDVLLGAHKGNEQHLGDFGFEVTQSGSSGTGGSGGGTPPAVGEASGAVTDQMTLNPIVGAKAEVIGTTLSANTDATGNFKLSNVTVGSQTIRVSAPGYLTKDVTVVITVGTITTANVQLVAAP